MTNRKQRTRINSACSSWEEVLFGAPQGSILGPFLYNNFLHDLFFASYADDNTPYTIGNDMEDVFFKLENSSKVLFQWFMGNQMKANPDKRHFVCSTK